LVERGRPPLGQQLPRYTAPSASEKTRNQKRIYAMSPA
jgi:hypothetical protein